MLLEKMELDDTDIDARLAMMKKRYAYFSEMVKPYSSLEEFAKEKDEWLAITGTELTHEHGFISLFMSLGFNNEYETYHIIPIANNRLAVSHVVNWLHPLSFNSTINIFTGESVDEKDIFTSY